MASTARDKQLFHEGDKVKAAHDLEGVPAGTTGRVATVTGLVWRRYRVDFANGASLNLLDGSELERA